MRFASVENALRYCYELGSGGNYGESVLATYMATDKSRRSSNSGMTLHDHIAQAGLIHRAVREALPPNLLMKVEAFYIVPGEPGSFLSDRYDSNSKHRLCVSISEWAPMPTDDDAYNADQVRRWAGLEPLLTQEAWGSRLGLSTRALQLRNRDLNRYLADQLNDAHNVLQDVFMDAGWLVEVV